MAGTSPVGTWLLTLFTSMLGSTYKASIDANFAVAQRSADNFAPHPASPAAMSVIVDAGFVDAVSPAGQQSVTEVAAQTLAISAAPSSPNNRIDLIVVDAGTGVASVIAGTPASSPVAPAIPAGKRQICQVSVPNGTAAIAAANITDLRASWGHYARGIPFAIAGGTADALTGVFTPATPTLGASQDGFIWRVRAASANATTTPSFAPDGQGPWTIKKQNGLALVAGDVVGAGAEILLAYNYNGGVPFIDLLNPAKPQVISVGAPQRQIFTTSGTFTPTVSGLHKITVLGGGGGSGGVNTTGTRTSSGGAAGALAIGWQNLTAGSNYTVTVGGAGTAGAATPTAGSNGGNSSFAGTATVTANGGGGSQYQSDSNLPGPPAGGTATGGDVNVQGDSPQGGNIASIFGDAIATNGASSPFGAGGVGGVQHAGAPGAPATGYGSGGGGVYATSASSAGTAGAPGIVIVEWVE